MSGWRTLWILVLATAVNLGCEADPGILLAARDSTADEQPDLTLVARLVQITDTHVVDEESPARFPGANALASSAWRPQESYSAQILDGIIRTVNRIHAGGRTVDFLIHTGDACDNAQGNELGWVLADLDGGTIDPLTGPDDRPADERPAAELDPHAPFQAQGLYRQGVHGDLPSIPWYILLGNHDVHGIGVFPIYERADGHRVAPLPLPLRPGWLLPLELDPVADETHGRITPADPGPPTLLELPEPVTPNPARAYFSKAEFIDALFESATEPTGHGFAGATDGHTWYSVSPTAGLRLIGLDTTDRTARLAGQLYHDGALSRAQRDWLRGELDAAVARDELVIVASHHPTQAVYSGYGVEVEGEELRALLAACPNVVLHVAGHKHRNRVIDRGGYLEIETCSTLDWPEEGRLVEVWRAADGQIVITYEMFSHLNDTLPPVGDDPLRGLREVAHELARTDKSAAARRLGLDADESEPAGTSTDREGHYILSR
ncbi:MAG: metallophosphoesterase [Phycisphaerae bacterium]|jgi:3',5'-cyclic AMP phosphodiesterase CpdA